jgi:hypothetical protein
LCLLLRPFKILSFFPWFYYCFAGGEEEGIADAFAVLIEKRRLNGDHRQDVQKQDTASFVTEITYPGVSPEMNCNFCRQIA